MYVSSIGSTSYYFILNTKIQKEKIRIQILKQKEDIDRRVTKFRQEIHLKSHIYYLKSK